MHQSRYVILHTCPYACPPRFGSYIVDNLRTHTQPVFVYLPTHATLRGGAWVVVDPTINERFMEMYAGKTGLLCVMRTSYSRRTYSTLMCISCRFAEPHD